MKKDAGMKGNSKYNNKWRKSKSFALDCDSSSFHRQRITKKKGFRRLSLLQCGWNRLLSAHIRKYFCPERLTSRACSTYLDHSFLSIARAFIKRQNAIVSVRNCQNHFWVSNRLSPLTVTCRSTQNVRPLHTAITSSNYFALIIF